MVRLVNVRDGCQLWSGSFERELRDGFEEEEALALEVIGAIRRPSHRRAGFRVFMMSAVEPP